jgi:hypothetical protein
MTNYQFPNDELNLNLSITNLAVEDR